jgi:small subunit ribosomal protein S6
MNPARSDDLAQNVYEGLFIFDSNRYSRDPGGVSGQIAEFIRKCGGEMMVSRLWEERRLAYPIEGQRKGTYWLTYFKLDSRQVATIERECQLSESILRCLVLKVEPRIVKALVDHAKSTAADPSKARRSEAPAKPVEPAVDEVVDMEVEEEVAEMN